MIEHGPKTAALLAYADDLLSAEGRARLERHLEGCEVCRRELAAIELYGQMVEETREAPGPEVDFDKMELALAREAGRISVEIQQKRRRTGWAPWLVAAAAAAVLALYVAWPTAERVAEAPRPSPPALPSPEPTPEPPAASPLAPIVTLAAGPTERLDGPSAAPLAVGDVVPEGARVRVGEGGLLHVRLEDGSGLWASAQTELSLERAREDGVRVALAGGRLGQEIAPIANGSSYVILCAGHAIEVRGTRFVVSYLEDVVGVDLSEGVVEVRTPDGEVIRLEAPARWRSSGAAADGEPEGFAIWGLTDDTEPTTAVTLAHPDVVRWRIGQSDLATGEELTLRMRRGEHELSGWDARGRLFTGLLRVGDAPVRLDPGTLEPEAPRIRAGHIAEEDIHRVIGRGTRQMQRCYELSLRRGEPVTGRGRLQVTVGLLGDVSRARVVGLSGPGAEPLATCIANYAGRWTFPPPGGPVSIEVPLALTPTQ